MGGEGPRLRKDCSAEAVFRAFGHNRNDAADRFRSPKRGLRAAENFDALNILCIKTSEVKTSTHGAGITDRDTIDQDKGLVSGRAAQAHCCGPAKGAVLVDRDTRRRGQDINREIKASAFDRFSRDDGDACPGLGRCQAKAGGLNDDHVIVLSRRDGNSADTACESCCKGFQHGSFLWPRPAATRADETTIRKA